MTTGARNQKNIWVLPGRTVRRSRADRPGFPRCYIMLHHLLMGHIRKRRRRRPPGPRFTLPILGHLPLLKKPLYASLADLAPRHGPAVHLRFGGRHAVVIGTAGLAKECFSGDLDIAIANRPHLPSMREASFDYSVLTLANFSALWCTMRCTRAR